MKHPKTQTGNIYVVICNSVRGPYFPERYIGDRATTIRQVSEGQYEDIQDIIECNTTSGACRNVTDEIYTEVGLLVALKYTSEADRQAQRWDHDRKLRNEWVA